MADHLLRALSFWQEVKTTFRRSPVGFCISVLIALSLAFFVMAGVFDFIEHMQYRSAHPYEEDGDVAGSY